MNCKMYCKIDLDNLTQTFIAKINSMSKDELNLFLKRANFKADLSKEEVIVTFKAKVDYYKHKKELFKHEEWGLLGTIGKLLFDSENLDVEPISKITKTKE